MHDFEEQNWICFGITLTGIGGGGGVILALTVPGAAFGFACGALLVAGVVILALAYQQMSGADHRSERP